MAVEFATRGAVLVLWDVNKSGNEGTARLVREIGGKAHTYVCDISKSEAVYETAAKVIEIIIVKEQILPLQYIINS